MRNVRVYPNHKRVIARHPDTQAALQRHSAVLASAARARLARHRKTGSHTIDVSSGRVDWFVNLRGVAAMSVEKGHHTQDGTFVPGLNILGGLL